MQRRRYTKESNLRSEEMTSRELHFGTERYVNVW